MFKYEYQHTAKPVLYKSKDFLFVQYIFLLYIKEVTTF